MEVLIAEEDNSLVLNAADNKGLCFIICFVLSENYILKEIDELKPKIGHSSLLLDYKSSVHPCAPKIQNVR